MHILIWYIYKTSELSPSVYSQVQFFDTDKNDKARTMCQIKVALFPP